jgi:uncharacterized membrane protein YraQ (UPF0718 family)
MLSVNKMKIAGLFAFICFVTASFILDFNPGKLIGANFFSFSIEMLKILPCAFILIGLFEEWVKRKTVEKHLGTESGFQGYLWTILLAGTTVGGLYVAFPIAYTLHSKGAKLSIIFTYIGASAICRVPMTIFEASFMGIKFSIIRVLASVPLVIATSILLGTYLTKRKYKVLPGK